MNTPHDANSCIVCHGNFNPYAIGDKDGYRFISCRACGSVITDPWPTQDALEKYYGDIQPEAVHAANPEGLIISTTKILGKVLPEPAADKAMLLDINAQRGYNTAAARKLGWKAVGLNTHEFLHRFAADNYGENNFVHSDLVSFAAQTTEKFNVIIAINALSEARDLDAFAAALASLLAPGGMIYLEEPDGNHFNTPRDFAGWSMVEPPITCAILSKKGMVKLLARHGLGIKQTFFSWLRPVVRAHVVHTKKK